MKDLEREHRADWNDLETLELFDDVELSIGQAAAIVRTNEALRAAGLPSINEKEG